MAQLRSQSKAVEELRLAARLRPGGRDEWTEPCGDQAEAEAGGGRVRLATLSGERH